MFALLRSLFVGTCLFLTAMASWQSAENLKEKSQAQFTMLVKDAQEVFRSRLDSYVHSLDSAAAFVASVPNLTARDWRNFVNLVDIQQNLPGISALGLVRAVPESEKDAFVAKRRADGLKSYDIHPVVETNEHLIIEFIEPFYKNERALGLDLRFDPVRAKMLEIARKTGDKVLSPPISLVQDPSTPGFVFTRPSYSRSENKGGEAIARGRIFHGWVVAPFRVAVTLANLTADQNNRFSLAVYDVTDSPEGLLIYNRQKDDHIGHTPRFTVVTTEPMFGRNWSMHFVSTPSFETSVDSYAPISVFISGLLMSGVLGLLLDVLGRRVNTVNNLVENRTRQLEAVVDENKSIVESAFLPILSLNDHDEIIHANAAATSLLGASRAAALQGCPIADFIAPATEPERSAALAFGAWTHRGADGRLLNIHRSSWTDAHKKPRHSLILQDVTEEANAAQRITDTEQRWYLALNGADIGVFDIDLTTGRSVVSKTWRRLMQVENEAPDYEPQADFLRRIHKDDLTRLKEMNQRCIEGKTERSICEYRIMGLDGKWRWMRSDAAVAERSNSGRAKRFIGAQMDVTELRMARQSLEISQKRFELVLSEAPVGMAVLNSDGFFTTANQAICQLLGYHESQLIGIIRLSDVISRSDMKKVLSTIGPRAANRAHAYQGDHECIARDGSKIWGLLSIAWTYDPETGGDIYIAQVNDITEKKAIERMKSEFVATVSHELRTPLTSIKGALGLLSTSPEAVKDVPGRLIEIAQNNADRLIAIVNDILDLEKITSGQATYDIATHSLTEIIEAAAGMIKPYADKNNVSLRLDLPDNDLIARLDPARLHQVLANLLSNACKFSYPGGEVLIRSETGRDQIIVSICDNGRGIPDSFKPQIFKPFVQADNSDTRGYSGTGLGLSIAHRIVTQMGGEIGFSSEADKLTVFWFTIPNAPVKTLGKGVEKLDYAGPLTTRSLREA